jgi:hypothetical protein
MFCEDGNHAFYAAEDGTVNHDWSSVTDTKRLAFCVIVLDFAVT